MYAYDKYINMYTYMYICIHIYATGIGVTDL